MVKGIEPTFVLSSYQTICSGNSQMFTCDQAHTNPPFAMTVCVPIITLLTRDIIANTAESLMTVVSISAFAKLTANS